MKVCVLGNSLTSLVLAKALVNENIYVDLRYQNKSQIPIKSRTLGISKSNVDFFNKNVINIDKLLWKLKKIEIYTDNLKNEKILNFENSNYELFSIIKNFKLLDILKKSLSKNKYFKKIISNKNLKDLEIYDLVINTEFSNSITKKYFSKKIIKEYKSTAFTTIIEHEGMDNNAAIQIFTRKGPLAFLPISKTETSVVYSLHNNLFNKKEENIKELIQHYNFKYNIKKMKKISSFELKSFILRSYYHGKILAFGDLLHKIHPIAGQGFNMTIRDLIVLKDLIKKKADLGLSFDASVNSEFENISKHNNYLFSNGIDLIHEFFNLERKSKNKLISKSVQFLGKNTLIKKIFTNIADRGIIL